MVYRNMYIAYSGNLSREKTFLDWWKNGISQNKLSWIARSFTMYCRPSLKTMAEETFADRHKTAKFAKVFSLESFPLYGNG